MADIKYPDVYVQLSGEDGNSMAIVARTRKALRRANVPLSEIEAYSNEALSGNYDNVLQTTMRWVSTS